MNMRERVRVPWEAICSHAGNVIFQTSLSFILSVGCVWDSIAVREDTPDILRNNDLFSWWVIRWYIAAR
jgi:hypothetical protein